MLDFLKRFGLGILYVVISPFAIAFLLLWALNALLIFIIEIFKGFKSFFKGKKFFADFEEDEKADRILKLMGNTGNINNSFNPSQNLANNNIVNSPTNEMEQATVNNSNEENSLKEKEENKTL